MPNEELLKDIKQELSHIRRTNRVASLRQLILTPSAIAIGMATAYLAPQNGSVDGIVLALIRRIVSQFNPIISNTLGYFRKP